MNDLTSIISTLTELQRFNELKETLISFEVIETPLYVNFEVSFFELSLSIKSDLFMSTLQKVNLSYLKKDYDHYKEMMEIDYPEKRKLNKIVKEYNSLYEKYSDVNIQFLSEELNYNIEKRIKDTM